MGGGAGNRGPQVWRPAQPRVGAGLAPGGAPKIGHAPVAPVKHVPNYPAPTSAAPRVQAPTPPPPFRTTTFQSFRTAAQGVKDFGTAKIAAEFDQKSYISKRLDDEGGGAYTQRMRGESAPP